MRQADWSIDIGVLALVVRDESVARDRSHRVQDSAVDDVTALELFLYHPPAVAGKEIFFSRHLRC
jgi:hypothetical protein